MLWAMLLALVQPAETVTRERVMSLVEKLPGSKSELVKLGPGALRILAEKPGGAVADVMFELKCAGLPANLREKLHAEIALRTSPIPLAEIDERCGAFLGIPIVVDLALDQDRRNRNVTLVPGRLDGVLRGALAPAGLEYAVVRGRIVISTPDRLWSYPAARAAVLDAEGASAVRRLIAQLGEAAAREALLETGPVAVPYLEEELRNNTEQRERIVELVRQIKARQVPAPFARGLVLERQGADDIDRVALRALRERTTTLKIESTLEGAVKLLARTAGLESDVPAAVGRMRVAVALGEMPVLDALYFLLASFDLDAGLAGGRLKIGATGDVEKKK